MLQGFLRQKTANVQEVRDTRSESDESFLAQCRERLQGLETIRQEKFRAYKLRKGLAVPAAVILTPFFGFVDHWLIFLQNNNGNNNVGGLSIAFLGALYAWVTSPKRQYAKAYKVEMLPSLAQLFGDFTYLVNGQIPVEAMRPSKIMPKHDRYETEDYFEGTYKGVHIRFSEVDFKERRRSKNRTYYVSIFKGLAILLDMKTKRFYGHTILDKERNKIVEWFKEKSSNLKTANLVDPEFEKLFDVYTSDQVEARYLIDPAMIERIKGLQAEYEGESITAAFYESKMLILIRSKHNHFEPADISIPATDPVSVLGMKKEIGEILSVIDRLSLYDPAKVHD